MDQSLVFFLIIYFLFTNSVFEARSIESKKFIKTEDYLIVQIEDRKIYIHPEIKNSAIKKDLMDLLKVKLFDVKIRLTPQFKMLWGSNRNTVTGPKNPFFQRL